MAALAWIGPLLAGTFDGPHAWPRAILPASPWAWGWQFIFAVIVTMMIFNTVRGEELLFRGLLPRMRSAFGRWDW